MKSIAGKLGWLVITGTLGWAQIAGLKPAAGTAVDGKIAISAGSDAATEIPITIVHGAKPGPTLAVIAGISGTDYAPILATRVVIANLNPAEMRGTIVLVHIANLPGFAERAVYQNPVDHKDLSRVFPGKADGTSSERIAYAITSQVIDKADVVVILEAGGSNVGIVPHVFQAVSGDAKLDAKMAAMALAFGINYIVVDKTAKASKGVEGVVLAASKAVLKVKCGSFGTADNRSMDTMTRGIVNVATLLEMFPGNPAKARNPVFFDQTVLIESPQTGVLFVYSGRGDNVHKGDAIFGVAGYTGKNPQVVKAPIDGIILSMMATPPVNKGEPVALIGVPREQP